MNDTMTFPPELNVQLATRWMATISCFILISVGSFGCLCNIAIFTSKQLRKNSCAFYFLCTTFFDLFILTFGGISRLATEYFGSTLLSQSHIYCKIRSYLITAIGSIGIYFVLLAAIDRWMATSTQARYRAFSQMKIAHRVALVTIIIGMGINLHALVFFVLQPSCIPQPGAYSLFYSLYLIVGTSIIPDGLILIFSVWTLKNARQSRLRVAPNRTVSTLRQRRMQRMEAQLVIMMIAQAFISIIIDMTRVSCYTYYFLTTHIPKSSYQQAVGVFIFQLSNVCMYFNHAKSFYIYTLASRLFRKVFCEIVRHVYEKLRQVLQRCSGHFVTIIQSSHNEAVGHGRNERI